MAANLAQVPDMPGRLVSPAICAVALRVQPEQRLYGCPGCMSKELWNNGEPVALEQVALHGEPVPHEVARRRDGLAAGVRRRPTTSVHHAQLAMLGVVVGLIIVTIVNTFRRKMSGLEEGSERYKQWTSKGWVKVLLWIFAGSGHDTLELDDTRRPDAYREGPRRIRFSIASAPPLATH